jgi:hypothetical protein
MFSGAWITSDNGGSVLVPTDPGIFNGDGDHTQSRKSLDFPNNPQRQPSVDSRSWTARQQRGDIRSQSDPNYRNIGNVDLIGKRNHRRVTVGPGGTLSDYVPFYFTPFSIMMFNIHTGYNVRQIPNEEILIVVSSLIRIAELHIPFVFTDQHAYPAMANYYTDLDNLGEIDWGLLNRRDFQHDPDDPGKKGAISGGSSDLETCSIRGHSWNLQLQCSRR